MGGLMNELLLSASGIMFIGGVLVTVLLGGFMPLMAWSATRNIKQIREQLERLNETLAARDTRNSGGPLGI